jgi:hypothetical protein
MEIYPIVSKDRDFIAEWKTKHKPTIFDRLPMTTYLFGSSGTGKSTAIANALIRNFDGLRNFFRASNIHIFAKNGLSDVSFRSLMVSLREEDPSWDNFSSDLDLTKIKALIERQRKKFDADPKKRLMLEHQQLLIIDDQIMNKAVSTRSTSGEIVELAVQGRHQCISTSILIQNISSLSVVARRNCTHVLAFRLNSQKERDFLFDDISHGNLTKKIVSKIYHFAI